jgi:hypothetical protein
MTTTTKIETGLVPLALRRLWKRGEQTAHEGPVLVSMNDYWVHRAVDLPLVSWEGMKLRAGWPKREGALGLWFCTLPGRRTVSVSIWRSKEDLHKFVWSPDHVRIMRRHRNTGTLTTTQRTTDHFDRWRIWDQAVDILAAVTAKPE